MIIILLGLVNEAEAQNLLRYWAKLWNWAFERGPHKHKSWPFKR